MAVTGWSNFWGGADLYSPLHNTAAQLYDLTRLAKRRGMLPFVRRLIALNGAAVGGAVSGATYVRSVASTVPSEFGGLRAVETVTLESGNTVAADETEIDNVLTESFAPTYATDRSGNGGGGKLGV